MRTAVLAYAVALRHFGSVLNIVVRATTNPLDARGFPEIPDPNGDNGAGVW
ncbi:hypothetical protein [Nocardia pseudovaccinii]|uniref:hypothetical protein n=1 Tax=Nocardia pseudovaccinii TaxID=189540 RepID=UPI0012F4AC45|nr:hypothetical protein [Nocardia pseudovaccinii]